MLNLTAIILTYNEEIHIRRCLENVLPISAKVYVVDSHSSDATRQIAAEMGADVVEHDWPGNQATQFNWALDNLNIDTDWILRLDADEYLLPELVDELERTLPNLPESVNSLSLSLARSFLGKRLRHGIVGGIKIVRIFRRGTARYEQRLMDEHLSILSGDTIELKGQFIDDNRMPIGEFITKHNNYASREAALLLDAEFGLSDNAAAHDHGSDVERKRAQKDRYARLPLFWRAWAYFIYRYIIRLGFLDGKEGFQWDFFQGLWYRMLVDAKVREAKRLCGNDREKIAEHVRKVLKIKPVPTAGGGNS